MVVKIFKSECETDRIGMGSYCGVAAASTTLVCFVIPRARNAIYILCSAPTIFGTPIYFS